MLLKAEWTGHPVRLRLSHEGLLILLVKHYVTPGTQNYFKVIIYKAFCLDVIKGRMNGEPSETQALS